MQVTFNVGLKISRWQAAEAFLHRTKAGDELFGMGAWEEAPLGLDLVLRDVGDVGSRVGPDDLGGFLQPS